MVESSDMSTEKIWHFQEAQSKFKAFGECKTAHEPCIIQCLNHTYAAILALEFVMKRFSKLLYNWFKDRLKFFPKI